MDKANRRDWRENVKFVASVVNSLAVPLLTVAATAVGIYATNTLKEREIAIATENNEQALRNQREESETNLRSAMFRELVGPLLQSETEALAKGEQADLPRAQRLALLAELLALNFHEHFELGPLLRYVDTLPGQTDDSRQRLRSTSRRVISRQLAPLLSTAVVIDGTQQNPSFLELSLNSDASEAADKLLSCALPAAAGDGATVAKSPTASSITLECSSTAMGAPLRIVSPDGQDSLQVNVRAVSWAAQTVGIYSVLLGPNNEAQKHTPPIEFTLSPYSFPFSDNTLLPSGNRFGIYLTRIDDIPDVARIMRLSFVWFPKDFVPPRERPFDLDVNNPPAAVPPVAAEAADEAS
ncbi:MAG TPA: hypothetical protein VFP48_01555 [Steroidobacteraceae bacterium]|nr:hypothetical protein [Steroidobacteraceae bacterium]